MGIVLTRSATPQPPVEIADEVELYARQYGRHATMRLVPVIILNGRVASATWVVSLSLRPTDPTMQLYQQGKVSAPPTEDIWLQEPNPTAGRPVPGYPGIREPPFRPLDIHQMGAGGVRAFLERGNLWSGRGQYKSLEEQVRETRAHNAELRRRNREHHREETVKEQMDRRRSRLKIPFLRVGIDLLKKKNRKSQGA